MKITALHSRASASTGSPITSEAESELTGSCLEHELVRAPTANDGEQRLTDDTPGGGAQTADYNLLKSTQSKNGAQEPKDASEDVRTCSPHSVEPPEGTRGTDSSSNREPLGTPTRYISGATRTPLSKE